jgi:hypothetical protein
VLHFDARTGKQVKENQRDTRWHTWSSTLGFPVMGIWPPDSDGTDVNACERSPCGAYLITADDFGKVRHGRQGRGTLCDRPVAALYIHVRHRVTGHRPQTTGHRATGAQATGHSIPTWLELVLCCACAMF